MKRNILAALLILVALVLSGCLEVSVDVKPQSCPNPISLKSKGVLPVAILGTDILDVCDVNMASLELIPWPADIPLPASAVAKVTETTNPVVSPIPGKIDYNDVSTPVVREQDCNCTEDGPDGYEDVVFYFDTQEVVAAIEWIADDLGIDVEDEQEWALLIGGNLLVPVNDDDDIIGYDCVVILKKGRHPN